MRRVFSIGMAVMIFFVFSTMVYGQDDTRETRTDIPTADNTKCTPLAEMNLTEEQNKAIEMVRASYRKEILQIRSNLMVKRIEFKELLKDPEADVEKIHATADDIEALRSSFDKMVLEYQLEIRKILTPGQIKSWCISEEMAVKRDWK